MKKKLRRITAFLLLSAMLFTSTGFENVIAAESQVEVEETKKNNTTDNTAPDGKKSAESTDPSLSEAESNHTAKQSSQDSDSEEITEGKDLKESDDTKKEEPSEKAKSSFQKIKPVVAAEGETGTDLDNFDIRLSWGDPEDNIGDTLTINNEDGSNQEIKLQVTVEYTGTEHYDAEDLSFKLTTLKDVDIVNEGFNTGGTVFYEDDIAAELKGSGSGRGDWFYVLEEDTEHFQDELNNVLKRTFYTYLFTNKHEINGAFTSSFQIVMRMKSPSVIPEEIKRTFSTAMTIKGLDGDIKSNLLDFDYSIPRITFTTNPSIQELTRPSSIITKLPQNATKDDYIFIDMVADVTVDNTKLRTAALAELTMEFPNDVIIGDVNFASSTNSDIFSRKEYRNYTIKDNVITLTDNRTTSFKNYIHYASFRDEVRIALAFPKSKYQAITNYKQSIKLTVSYLNSEWHYDKKVSNTELAISFPDINYEYDGNLLSLSVDRSGKGYLNSMRKHYPDMVGKVNDTNKITCFVDAVYVGKEFDIEVGSDLAFYRYSDNTSRQLQDDERYISKVYVGKDAFNNAKRIELHGKRVNSDDYVLIDELKAGVYGYCDYEITSGEHYSDAKVKIIGGNNSINELSVIFSYGFSDNEELDNGKIPEDIYFMPYADYYINGKSYMSGKLPYTNIQGLKEIIKEHDETNYNRLRFRNDASFDIVKSGFKIGAWAGLNFESVDIINNELIIKDSIFGYTNFMNPGGENIKQIQIKAYIPKYIYIELGEIEIPNNNTEIFIEETETNNVLIVSQSINPQDTINMNPNYEFSLNTNFKGKIPLDEFLLRKLSGEKINIKQELVVTYDVDGKDNYWENTSSGITSTYPSIAKSSYQGVMQEVGTRSNGYQTGEVGANLTEEYQYKFRLGSGQSKMKYMQFFTNLEQEFGDKAHWNGIFNGTDVSVMEEATGEDIKVYYSDNPAQKHDLSASGWIEDKNWSKELSDVKSVAFNLGNCIIGNGDAAYVLINMLAPADTEKKGLLAYNKFTASYKAYDVNEIELDETNYLEDVKDLPSNVTEVRLGDSNKRIVIDVDWQDEDNKYGKRPSCSQYDIIVKQDGNEYQTIDMNSNWYTNLNVPIYKDAFGTKYDYTIEVKDYSNIGYATEIKEETKDYGDHFQVTNTLDPDKYILLNLESIWNDNYDKLSQRPNIQSISIKKNVNGTVSNYQTAKTEATKDWKYQMVLPKKDNNGSLITYTIEPATPSPYTTTFTGGITENGDYDFAITNELSYEDVMTSILVVKKWNDEENVYRTRPESIKVNVLQEGQAFAESEITAADGWKKDIQVPKYKNWDMEEYQYSIEELPVDKYDSQLEYSTGEDGNYKITFDGQSKTEGTSYDYVEIYYDLNGTTYKAGKWGGSDIKGKSLIIPTKEFYVYWKTDGIVDDYWGYAIDSIEKTEEEAVSGTQASLPNVTVKNTTSKFDLQSDHSGNYGNNIQELWHYTPEYYLLINTLDKASVTTEISGVKTWQDEGNSYNIRPEEITVNLMQDGKKLTSTTTNAEQNWKYTFTNIPVFKTDSEKFEYTISEEPVKGYNFKYQKNNLAYKGNIELVFDSQSETESTNYDFVEIYYEQNEQIMKTGPFGGKDSNNKIAGASVVIPTTEFYVYWRTDNSNDSYYGYRVMSVNKTDKEATKATTASLPTGVTPVNTKSINDLQSKHGSYGNNVKELWHYTSDLGSDSYSYDLVNTLDTSMLSGNIEITQQVDIVDIIHGNPTFIVEATNGKDTFYKALTFKQAGEQKITMTDLPSGTYTVTVKHPPRYKLTDIKDIKNGERNGNSVTLNVQGDTGKATFVSKKTNWKNYSHSDAIINQVHPK